MQITMYFMSQIKKNAFLQPCSCQAMLHSQEKERKETAILETMEIWPKIHCKATETKGDIPQSLHKNGGFLGEG